MGRGKYIRKKLPLLIIIGLILFHLFLCSREKGRMFITNIALTKNSIVIEIEKKKIPRNFHNNLEIIYKNIPESLYFRTEIQEKWHNDGSSTVTMTVDLSDMTFAVYEEREELFNDRIVDIFYINEEATLVIQLTGSSLGSDIFIEEDKISILDQNYSSNHPFMW